TNDGWALSVLRRHSVSRREGISSHGTSNDGSRKETIQSVEKAMASPRIPNTDSIHELAKFWDEHDLTDFENELEEVSTRVFLRRKETTVEVALTARE